jgi:hypothetical protein
MTTKRANGVNKAVVTSLTVLATSLTVPAAAQEKKLVAVLEFRNEAGLSEYEGG